MWISCRIRSPINVEGLALSSSDCHPGLMFSLHPACVLHSPHLFLVRSSSEARSDPYLHHCCVCGAHYCPWTILRGSSRSTRAAMLCPPSRPQSRSTNFSNRSRRNGAKNTGRSGKLGWLSSCIVIRHQLDRPFRSLIGLVHEV